MGPGSDGLGNVGATPSGNSGYPVAFNRRDDSHPERNFCADVFPHDDVGNSALINEIETIAVELGLGRVWLREYGAEYSTKNKILSNEPWGLSETQLVVLASQHPALYRTKMPTGFRHGAKGATSYWITGWGLAPAPTFLQKLMKPKKKLVTLQRCRARIELSCVTWRFEPTAQCSSNIVAKVVPLTHPPIAEFYALQVLASRFTSKISEWLTAA